MPVIVSPFGFLEMQVEGVLGQALELAEPDFCNAPEALDAVDVDALADEFIVAVIDAEVAVAEIDEALIARPAIGVDNGARVELAADNALQRAPGAVRDDLGVDLPEPGAV